MFYMGFLINLEIFKLSDSFACFRDFRPNLYLLNSSDINKIKKNQSIIQY